MVHVRPENLAADRIDRRLAENQSGKRQVVLAMRERGGRTLAQVFPTEANGVAAIRRRIAKGTVLHADESPAWNVLHAGFTMRRINHQVGFSVDGACTNAAESYFSRLRRGEVGHHHHIAGPYLVRYAQEAACVRTCAGSAMATKSIVLSGWRCAANRRSIVAATGNAPRLPSTAAN